MKFSHSTSEPGRSLRKTYNNKLEYNLAELTWTKSYEMWKIITHGPGNSTMVYILAITENIPDSKVHGANMGPIWGRQDPGGPHVGPMNFAIWDVAMAK